MHSCFSTRLLAHKFQHNVSTNVMTTKKQNMSNQKSCSIYVMIMYCKQNTILENRFEIQSLKIRIGVLLPQYTKSFLLFWLAMLYKLCVASLRWLKNRRTISLDRERPLYQRRIRKSFATFATWNKTVISSNSTSISQADFLTFEEFLSDF